MKAMAYLPNGVAPESITAVIGLISDTHAPARSEGVPPVVHELFKGVDLILHSGDVGELWVLDELGTIAPTVAVHGNDEPPYTIEQLPFQQIVTVHGVRILLWHSHIPNRQEELAFRQRDDTWERILNRSRSQAAESGASVVIYGHTHVPMVKEIDGITVINPGAIAPGRFLTRQRPTVAILYVLADKSVACTHIEIKVPDRPLELRIDWAAGFMAGSRQFEEPFTDLPHLMKWIDGRQLKDLSGAVEAYREIALPYWRWEKDWMALSDFIESVEASERMHPDDKAYLLEYLRSEVAGNRSD